MTLKLLFLDVDGVLNSKHRRGNDFGDPLAGRLPAAALSTFHIAKLKILMEKIPDLKIVISSTWRIMYRKELIEGLQTCGIDVERIIGDTPITMSDCRGGEVERYLNDVSEPFKYAILDDYDDFYEEQKPFFFRTTWEDGLTSEIVSRIVEHFEQ